MFQEDRIRESILAVIQAIGDNPDREGLRETPRRVAEMYRDLFSGLGQDARSVLAAGFEEGHQELVTLKNIPFYSMCEHHLLPFFGSAHIGYIPRGRVVGASTLAQVVDIIAHRPQIQERLTNQVADVIFEAISPEGVAVLVEAEHLCMSMRGVKKPGMVLLTSATRGEFSSRAASPAEFLRLLKDS